MVLSFPSPPLALSQSLLISTTPRKQGQVAVKVGEERFATETESTCSGQKEAAAAVTDGEDGSSVRKSARDPEEAKEGIKPVEDTSDPCLTQPPTADEVSLALVGSSDGSDREQETKAPVLSPIQNWGDMYESLEAFHKTNGHVKVPSASSDAQLTTLFIWLRSQRRRYKAMKDPAFVVGNIRSMTSDEYDKLNALGVKLDATVTNLEGTSGTSKTSSTGSVSQRTNALKTKIQWDEMYEPLKEFHKRNGHVKVPSKSSDAQVKKLYFWLGTQRKRYRAMMDPRSDEVQVFKYRPMTSEEYEKLTALGVDLAVLPSPKIQWDEMYESLETFHKTNGHVKVPHDSSDVQVKKLYRWLCNQRMRYRAMVDPRSTVGCQGFKGRPMTSEEREKLTALGVDLAVASRPKLPWDEMYGSLEAFHQTKGHVKVPRNSSDVQLKKLYRWLLTQRQRYKAMVDSRPDDLQGSKGRPMTSDEYNKLNALGVELDPQSKVTNSEQTSGASETSATGSDVVIPSVASVVDQIAALQAIDVTTVQTDHSAGTRVKRGRKRTHSGHNDEDDFEPDSWIKRIRLVAAEFESNVPLG